MKIDHDLAMLPPIEKANGETDMDSDASDDMNGFVHDLRKCLQNSSPRHRNTGLGSNRVSLNSWGEGASLALVSHPSSDGITIKIPYGLHVLLRRPASHPIFSYWVG